MVYNSKNYEKLIADTKIDFRFKKKNEYREHMILIELLIQTDRKLFNKYNHNSEDIYFKNKEYSFYP